MIMLITIVARIEIGKIEGETLCRVQAKAWEDITTQPSSTIGEEVLLLSAARDRDFETGCRNAFAFGSMLIGNSIFVAGSGWPYPHDDLPEADPSQTLTDRDDLSAAWERFFDTRILTQACDVFPEPGQISH